MPAAKFLMPKVDGRTAGEDALLELEHGRVHGEVDLLDGRRQHVGAEVVLVGVDADAPHALGVGRAQRAEAAAAGDREDDVGALRELRLRERLALGRVGERVGVAVQRLDARACRLGARLEARDVVVDRRDLDSADRRHHVLAVVAGPGDLLHQAREVARDVARLLLVEGEAQDVLAITPGRIDVDDRELRRRELLRHGLDRIRHQEADRDHEVVVLRRERREVRDVVRTRLRLQDLHLHPELLLGLLQPEIGEVVERAVVQSADVGHETDPQRCRLRGGSRRASAVRARDGCRGECRDGDQCGRCCNTHAFQGNPPWVRSGGVSPPGQTWEHRPRRAARQSRVTVPRTGSPARPRRASSLRARAGSRALPRS